MSNTALILYRTEDGLTELQLKSIDGTVWLTQRDIAILFSRDVRTINEHLQNIYEEQECLPEATIRKFRIVQTEGERSVEREIEHYNLDAILAVGYRVKSARGTQFRIWATTTLRGKYGSKVKTIGKVLGISSKPASVILDLIENPGIIKKAGT